MEGKAKLRPDSKLRLMDQVKQVLRYHHYAYRTEQTYCDWILRYVKFQGGKTHPKDMGKTHVEAFLSHLATQGRVSASNLRQDSNAPVFLYRHVMDKNLAAVVSPLDGLYGMEEGEIPLDLL